MRRTQLARNSSNSTISKSNFFLIGLLIATAATVGIVVPLSMKNNSKNNNNDNNNNTTIISFLSSSSSSSTGSIIIGAEDGPNITTSGDGIYHYYGSKSIGNLGIQSLNSHNMSPDGTVFAMVGDNANSIFLFQRNPPDGLFEFLQVLEIENGITINSSLAFSDFGNYLAISNQFDQSLSIYQRNFTTNLYQRTNYLFPLPKILSVGFSANSEWICVSSNQNIALYRANYNQTVSAAAIRKYAPFQTVSGLFSINGLDSCSLDQNGLILSIGDNLAFQDGSHDYSLVNYVRQITENCNFFTGKCTTLESFNFNYMYTPNLPYYGFDVQISAFGKIGYVLFNNLQSMDIFGNMGSGQLRSVQKHYNSTIQYDLNYYGNVSTIATDGILLVQNVNFPNVSTIQQFNASGFQIESAFIDNNATFILAVAQSTLLHLRIEGY